MFTMFGERTLSVLTKLKNYILPQTYVLQIHLPIEADTKEYKPLVDKVKGISLTAFYEKDGIDHIFALADWRENDIPKRLRSLYLRLPDYSYVEVIKV